MAASVVFLRLSSLDVTHNSELRTAQRKELLLRTPESQTTGRLAREGMVARVTHKKLKELFCRHLTSPFVSSSVVTCRPYAAERFLFHASVYLVLRRGDELLMV